MKLRALSLLSVLPILGCSIFGDLQDDGGVINVFATHHATAVAGAFPPRDGPMDFVNDEGWTITVRDTIITTTGVTLFKCGEGGDRSELEMYWGALPEDFIDEPDLETIGVGGVQSDSGEYCGTTIHYGPYKDLGLPDHYELTIPAAEGSTVYITGLATKAGEQDVDFEMYTSQTTDVLISLQTIENNGPLTVSESENPRLVVAKTYDHIFDGVDFATFSFEQADVDDLLIGVLNTETQVWLGDPKP